MDKEAFKAALVVELKELRRGAGVAKKLQRGEKSLLAAMANYDSSNIVDILVSKIKPMPVESGRLLANALAIDSKHVPGPVSLAEDLTSRRDWYVKRYSMSDRTLTRREDAEIEKLADSLVPKTEDDLQSLVRRYPPAERFLRASQPQPGDRPTSSQRIPGDVPGILRAQAKAIGRLRTGSLQSLPAQLEIIEQTNRKLAEVWGVELE